MDPQLKDLLLQSLIFEPVPMVSRVVFVSTPHRGSPLGEFDWTAGLSMIRVPNDILQIRKTLAEYNGQANDSEAFRGNRYATSVAQLGMGNPVLHSINQLPLSETSPITRSSATTAKSRFPREATEWSLHRAPREEALSELVISSDHSAQEKQPGHRGDEANSHAPFQRIRTPAQGAGERARDRPSGPPVPTGKRLSITD